MLVPWHVAVMLLLRRCRWCQVMMVGLGRLSGHVASHTHARGQGALNKAMRLAHARDRTGHVVRGVHFPGKRLDGLLGDRGHLSGDWAGLLFYWAHSGGARCSHRSAGTAGWHQPRLLGMALLQMASQVVSAAKALGTARTQEVTASCVHHRMTAHILTCVKTAVASLTGVLPLSYWHHNINASL